MELVHGTCVAIDGAGVLLRGPSGSGKSDLALRLIDAGATLVGDDRLDLIRVNDRLVARPPGPLQGKLEIRGIGIVAVEAVAQAPLVLVVDLIPADQVVRFPDPAACHYLALPVPLLALAAFEASTPAKITVALRNLGAIQ